MERTPFTNTEQRHGLIDASLSQRLSNRTFHAQTKIRSAYGVRERAISERLRGRGDGTSLDPRHCA
eukprot:7680363-Lingulodinium_polyedra.AAC.1